MSQAIKPCRIRIGPSGWSYPDWKGIVYPAAAGSRFDALDYLSGYFETIEINSSFYRPPTPRMAQSWIKRVAHRPDFRFALKLWQRLTHELPAAPSRPATSLLAAEVEPLKAALDPLAEAGRLGGLLMQFPWSFRNHAASLDWLEQLRQVFHEYPLIVELRHKSWDAAPARQRLRDLGLNYCNIDQPLLNQCLAPSSYVTGPVGYVRLHGRRYDTWFADNVPASARYDYLYREDELSEWVSRLRAVAQETESLYVFANNHYRGQGPANALQLRAMIEQDKIEVPPDMLVHFPFLNELAANPPPPKPRQQKQFDM